MRILVVEDDYITREAIKNCLLSEGYQVELAENGKLGVEAWRKGDFSLVCLDIMMPEMNGYEVCRRIRDDDEYVPILFLSAKREEIDVVLGLEMGADDFIGKPFGKHEFLARIKTVIRRSRLAPTTGQASFQMGAICVYPDELRARRGSDEVIELSPREVSILTLMYQSKEKPVTRDRFLDVCWGLDYEYSRTLDTHIANLRKKIEYDPTKPRIIQTVRGVGYKYSESVS